MARPLSRFISPLTVLALAVAGLTASPAHAVTLAADLTGYASRDWSTQQYHLTTTAAPTAWSVTRGEGTIVAVIDTGVDATHPDLAGQVLDGFVYTQSSTGVWVPVPTPASKMTDEEGHGTHVAGIIAAKANEHGTTGVAPGAKILPIKVADAMHSEDPGDAFSVLRDAIVRAVAEGADVINMSLGAPGIESAPEHYNSELVTQYEEQEKEICKAIYVARKAGVVVVASSGNEGLSTNPVNYPAACEDAVSVAATNPNNQVTFFSSYDDTVDIAAPGWKILSTLSRTQSPIFPYGEMSGTSMAAPVVAGVAALARAAHPDFTGDQMRDLLYATATDEGIPGSDPLYGHGIVDAAAAVGAASPRTVLAPAAALLIDVRRAVNDDPTQFTASWEPPAAQSLPTGYTLRVFTRYGAALETRVISGRAVRATFTVPAQYAEGFWVALSADYADGTTLSAAPQLLLGAPVALTGVTFTPGTDAEGNTTMTVAWNPVSVLEGSVVLVDVQGFQFDRGGFREVLSPDIDGNLPTSVTLTLDDKLHAAHTLHEFDIHFQALTVLVAGSTPVFSEPAAAIIPAAAGKGVGLVEVYADNSSVVTNLGLSSSALPCGVSCAGKTISVVFTTTTKVKKAKGWTTRTSTLTRQVKLDDPDVHADGAGDYLVEVTGPKVTKTTVTVTVAVKLGKKTLMTARPVVKAGKWITQTR